MSDEFEITTMVYDGVGRVSECDSGGRLAAADEFGTGGTTTTMCYDRHNRVTGSGLPPLPPPSEPLPEWEPIERLFAHTFEFRLAGSEEKFASISLPTVPAGDRVITAIRQVRTFVTRGNDLAAGTAIGSVEVWTATRARVGHRPAMLDCFARISDFAATDLVVVQVDVTVEWAQFGDANSD